MAGATLERYADRQLKQGSEAFVLCQFIHRICGVGDLNWSSLAYTGLEGYKAIVSAIVSNR